MTWRFLYLDIRFIEEMREGGRRQMRISLAFRFLLKTLKLFLTVAFTNADDFEDDLRGNIKNLKFKIYEN